MAADAVLTGVTLSRDAFGDPRFEYLAQLCGLADADHARGKIARLWSVCTALETDTPTRSRIVVCLGPRGPEALVEADLGELAADGQIRVKGCERHTWYGKTRRVEGGKARVAGAARGPDGRLLPRPAPDAGPASPAGIQLDSSKVQRGPAQDQGSDQGSENRGGRGIRDDRDHARPEEAPRLPLGEPIPDGWTLGPGEKNAAAVAKAKARGVVVEHAVEKFAERMRAGGDRAADWDARARAMLLTERPTEPKLVASLAGPQRKHAARAARDREREADAERARRAVEDREAVWTVAKQALATNFQLPDEKATG